MRWIFLFIFIFTLLFGGWIIYSQTDLKTLSFGDQDNSPEQKAEYFDSTLKNGIHVKHWFEPNANTTLMQLEFQAGHHYQMDSEYPAWQFVNALQQRFDQASISVAYAGIELKNIELTATTLSITLSMLSERESDAAQLLNKVLLQGPALAVEDQGLFKPVVSLARTNQVDAQTWFNAHINRDTASLAVISRSDSKSLLNNLDMLNNLPKQIGPKTAMGSTPNGQLKVQNAQHTLVIFSEQNLPKLTQIQLKNQFNSAHSGGLFSQLKQKNSADNFSALVHADQIVFSFSAKEHQVNDVVAQIYNYIGALQNYANKLIETQQDHSAKLVSTAVQLSFLQKNAQLPVIADSNLAELLKQFTPASSLLLLASNDQKTSNLQAFSTTQLVAWQGEKGTALIPAIDQILVANTREYVDIASIKSPLLQRHPERLVVNDQWQSWFKAFEFEQMVTLNIALYSNDQAGLTVTEEKLNQAFAQMFNSLFKQSGRAKAYLGDQKNNTGELIIEMLAHESTLSDLSHAVIETVLKDENGQVLMAFDRGQAFVFGQLNQADALALNQSWMQLLTPNQEVEGTPESNKAITLENSLKVLNNNKVNGLSWYLAPELFSHESEALLLAMQPYLELGLKDYFFVQRENALSVEVFIEQGLSIEVTSNEVNPGLLELHLQKALAQVKESLLQMSGDEFSQINMQRAQYQQREYLSALEISQDYWQNVKEGQLNFNQRTLDAIALERISKDQLVKFIEQSLLSDKSIKSATHQVKANESYNVKEFLEGRKLLK